MRIPRKRKRVMKDSYRRLLIGIMEHQHPGRSKRFYRKAAKWCCFAVARGDERVHMYLGPRRVQNLAFSAWAK
jgi:hypothetical protein